MNKYDLVVFDLDGTILDTSAGILSSAKYAINEMGFEVPEDETMKSLFIGPPIQDSFAKLYGVEGNDKRQMADLFRNRYKDHDLFLATPYDGIYQVFKNLIEKNVKVAIATYKREDYALRLLSYFKFDLYTSIMYGSDLGGLLKKNDIILKCINDANVYDYSRVVMIGDSLNDELGAEKLGIDFIGVTYGFGYKTVEDIRGPNVVGRVASPKHILQYI